jgi:tetratricopeptide (TPR) repeat protein
MFKEKAAPAPNSICCFINNLIVSTELKLVDVVLFCIFASSKKKLVAMKQIISILFFAFLCSTGFAQTAKEFYNSGNEKLDHKKYKDAIKEFTKAIEDDQFFADAYYNRGLAKNNIKDYQGALADYTKTIELNPLMQWPLTIVDWSKKR